MYKKTILKNGLRIITHEMKDRESISMGFWVGVGGRYESNKTKGSAHLLEHMLFKGSKKYSCEDIKINIEGVGGTLNAFTSEEQTCFYAKVPTKHLDQTFDVLADMLFYPQLCDQDLQKEKTVIIEEIKMYHDLPQFFVLELLDDLLWPGHPLGKNLAGTAESVMAISRKDLERFHSNYYSSGNIVISLCGKLKHEKIVQTVTNKLKGIKGKGKWDYKKVERKQTRPGLSLYKKDIEQMHLALGIPSINENHKDRYVLSLLSIILGGNMSSRLFVEVREKRGWAYSISSISKYFHDTGVFLIRAGVDNRKIVYAVDLILKELDKIKNKGVKKGEFTRAKDYLLGQLLLSLEDTMDHMLWIGDSLISRNKTRTLKNVIKDFEKINIEDIKRVANNLLKENKYNLAIIGPISDKQELEIKRTFKK